jgi:hypothetical protein
MRIVNSRKPGGKSRPPMGNGFLFVLLGVGFGGLAVTLAGGIVGGLAGALVATFGVFATMGAAGLFGMEALRALLAPRAG